MQELTEDYKTIIKDLQQEISSLKEKVSRLSNEIFDVQIKIKKKNPNILGYGSEYDD